MSNYTNFNELAVLPWKVCQDTWHDSYMIMIELKVQDLEQVYATLLEKSWEPSRRASVMNQAMFHVVVCQWKITFDDPQRSRIVRSISDDKIQTNSLQQDDRALQDAWILLTLNST